jgi:predicted HD phosphohydrolase
MSELTIAAIRRLFEARGGRRLPSAPITLLEHALQTAWFAERAGASGSLVCACLLHDLGHALDPDAAPAPAETAAARGHGPRAAARLHGLFGAAVTDPIRLHGAAKRYLCYAHPGYSHGLSDHARRSLAEHGGAFTAEEARVFMREPHAVDAVNLRLWDDQAHAAGIVTPSLAHFAATMRTCVLPKGSLYLAAEGS